ncbi:hypothetical protein QTJ16_001079 [Diplocarpon rosae]|uniref:Ras modification protein ERF4 n=1 Tax=Diplocarpon rosae TaxID=946125 RepID=A0AAD9WI02_9HELO|nr:hypothetical protein QTJ16_001079 [Diplocarpon rosae]
MNSSWNPEPATTLLQQNFVRSALAPLGLNTSTTSTPAPAALAPQHRRASSHEFSRREAKVVAPGIATSTLTLNPRIPLASFQPTSSPSIKSSGPEPHAPVTSPTRWSLRNALVGGPDFASPLRSRSGTGGSSISRGRPRGPSLWNPSNSTPRGASQRADTRTRERSPEQRVIAIPLNHPDIESPRRVAAAAGGAYPLLTLPEQRQKRHSESTGASLQVGQSGSPTGTNGTIPLPPSPSIESPRRRGGELSPKLGAGRGKAVGKRRKDILIQIEKRPATPYRTRAPTITDIDSESPTLSSDQRRGKPNMSGDLERGQDHLGEYEAAGTSNMPNTGSHASFQSGIGAAMSDNSSIVGSDGPPMNPADEWGPQHPCFPHVNNHVPLSSSLYQSTRIIRIRRDWMVEGDLAPTFSNLYPEILEPAGVSEQEFRALIERVNTELIAAFSPYSIRNIVDGILGLLTGWFWDDTGLTAVKSRLRRVELYLEEWNREMEGRSKEEPERAPRVVPLRRTGYMNVGLHPACDETRKLILDSSTFKSPTQKSTTRHQTWKIAQPRGVRGTRNQPHHSRQATDRF